MPPASCANCGSRLPKGSRFCPECGVRIGAEGATLVDELPPEETGPVPVHVTSVSPRFFRLTPPMLPFALAAAAVALAVYRFAGGHWLSGLVLLLLAAVLFVGFLSLARRRPGEAPAVARVSASAIEAVRSRAELALEAVAAHSGARIELARLRRELAELAAVRGHRLRGLGEAAYAGENRAARSLKAELRELDQRIEEKEAEMERVAQAARERIERAQLQVQPTEMLRAEGEEPEPAVVPEPFPPPDEGEPPQPAVVPEPFPPPDEADRPQQPMVPEPTPGHPPQES